MFARRTDEIVACLKKLNYAQLKKVLKVSDALTTLNYKRFQTFRTSSEINSSDLKALPPTEIKPAVLAYTGQKTENSRGLSSLSHI